MSSRDEVVSSRRRSMWQVALVVVLALAGVAVLAVVGFVVYVEFFLGPSLQQYELYPLAI